MKKSSKVSLGIVVLAVVAACAVLLNDQRTLPYHPPQTAQSDLDAAIKRGRYVAIAGDCEACHNDPQSGRAFAGGYALHTPFGTIVASNITPDVETGIGSWNEQEFARAVRDGKGKHGEHLYPAMPYNTYAKVSDADLHDLWLYMRTVAPVPHSVEANQLPFPFNIRLLMAGWNLLFFDHAGFRANPAQTASWNRGAYLVEGLEHCTSCHTPKNFLGGDKRGSALYGTSLQGWFAPDITSNAYTGIGAWSKEELIGYLRSGANRYTVAAGPMGEAVENSTQHLSDQDLAAIADYLKSTTPSPASKPAPLPANEPSMALGAQVFSVNCEACHRHDGDGVPDMIPKLSENAAMVQSNPEVMLRTILIGNRGVATETNPTGAAMPSFDWKLTDAQIAAVATYLRNTHGNAASAVSEKDVAQARQTLKAKAPIENP